MGDQEIIELYWRRSEAAISESQRAYGPYCLTIAQRVLSSHEDAEECVSDTWLRAWQAMPPQRPGKLRAFFGRITRNLSLDRYAARRAAKRGGGQMELVLDELAECLPAAIASPEQAIVDAELETLVNRFLHSLGQRERHIFLARYWDLLPLQAVAERYGMTEGAVKSSLFRSREKLRRFLQEEDVSI